MSRGSEEKRTRKMHERILGTIYGQCIGDAIGLMTEFMDEEETKEYYGKKRGRIEYSDRVLDFHRTGWSEADWTDDSDQMILIMLSLIENNGKVDLQDYAGRLLKWRDHGFAELGDPGGLGIGGNTSKVLHQPHFPTDPVKAARDVWDRSGRTVAPNGGVMRTSVLGLYMYHDIHAVVRNARAFCTVTHADPRCEASCVAVAVAIALMMQAARSGHKLNLKSVTEQSYEHAAACIVDDNEDVRAHKLGELRRHMFAVSLPALELTEHKRIGYTYKCLGAGFWALRAGEGGLQGLVAAGRGAGGRFREALEAVMFAGGDADTNGAVAGALLGCRLGVQKLPPPWLALKHKDWLDPIINQFIALIERTSPDCPKMLKEPTLTSVKEKDCVEGDNTERTEEGAAQPEAATNADYDQTQSVKQHTEALTN